MATGYNIKTVKLLDGQTTSTASPGTAAQGTLGGWFMIGKFLSPTATIQGVGAGDTISIRVSNNDEWTPPLPSDNGVPHNTLGSVTSDSGGGLGGAFTWIKATKVDGGTHTSTNVYLQMQIAK